MRKYTRIVDVWVYSILIPKWKTHVGSVTKNTTSSDWRLSSTLVCISPVFSNQVLNHFNWRAVLLVKRVGIKQADHKYLGSMG